MGLTQKIDGGWQGVVTGKVYIPPRDCEESAEAQERQAYQNMPMLTPKGCKRGSKEEADYKAQEEALSNVERAELKDTAIAYRTFRALHPELPPTENNDDEISEYFALQGVKFVRFNGANVPLVTNPERWEEAYQWKLARGRLGLDPKVMNDKQRREAQEKATEFLERRPPSEDELERMADKEIARRQGAW